MSKRNSRMLVALRNVREGSVVTRVSASGHRSHHHVVFRPDHLVGAVLRSESGSHHYRSGVWLVEADFNDTYWADKARLSLRMGE